VCMCVCVYVFMCVYACLLRSRSISTEFSWQGTPCHKGSSTALPLFPRGRRSLGHDNDRRFMWSISSDSTTPLDNHAITHWSPDTASVEAARYRKKRVWVGASACVQRCTPCEHCIGCALHMTSCVMHLGQHVSTAVSDDTTGAAALHIAAAGCCQELAELLLDRGARRLDIV